ASFNTTPPAAPPPPFPSTTLFRSDDPELLPLVIGAAGDAACSDQYVLSAHPLPADLDGVRASQPSPALDNLHAGIGEQALIDAIKTGDLGVLVLDQRLPVEMALSKAPAIAGRMFEFFSEGTGIDHQLLRHAADVDAGTPQMALFSHRDPFAGSGCHATCAHAAGAGANHEEVVVIAAHLELRVKIAFGPGNRNSLAPSHLFRLVTPAETARVQR